MNWLVIRFSAMGDVALTLPVLKAALAQNPKLKITVVSKAFFAPLFANTERLYFHGVDLNQYKGITGLWKLSTALYALQKFELVIDLHNSLRSRTIRTFLRWKGLKSFVIDKGRAEKKQLTQRQHKQLKPLRHTVERYAEVFAKAGLRLSMPTISQKFITVTPNLVLPDWSQKTTLIGIAPFAGFALKEWPENYMAELIKKLSEKIPEAPILLFGGNADLNRLEKLKQGLPNIWLSPQIAGGLAVELALIEKLKLMLCMDSGNMHLAALLQVPVLCIFGPTHPYLGFGPYLQPDGVLQMENLACRPCSVFGNVPCYRGDHACMQQLSVAQVSEAVWRTLQLK